MTGKSAPPEERVVRLPLGEMHPFKGYPALRGIMPGNQPYHVRDDDPSMQQIAATVKERGVRQPGIVIGYLEGQGCSLASDLASGALYRLDMERIGRTGNLLAPPVPYTMEEAVEFAVDMNEEVLNCEEDKGKAAILKREGDLLRGLLQRMHAEN